MRVLLIPLFVTALCVLIISYDLPVPAGSQIIKDVNFKPCSEQITSTESLPHNWRSDARGDLICGDYEFEFAASEMRPSIAILVPQYRFHINFYVNDIELSSSKGRRNQVRPFYTEVPIPMLEQGVNKFRIELLSDPKGEAFLDKVIIGSPAELAKLESTLTWFRFTIPFIISVVILIFSGISVFLFMAEREAKDFLYFSIFSTTWVMNIFNLMWSEPFFSTYTWLKIVSFSLLMFCTFGCLFVSEFLHSKFPRIDKIVKIMALIWLPIIIVLPFSWFRLISLYFLMPYILVVGVLTVYKFFRTVRSEHNAVVGNLYLALNTAIIVTGTYDVGLMMNLVEDSMTFYLTYSATGLILSIWFHMFSKYFRLLKLEENFSNVLKAELGTQKQGLEDSLKREKVAIQQSAALRERDSLMRDLHDSFGARLISLIRLSKSERKVHKLARETLDELRFMTTPLRIEDCDIVTLLATFREQRLRRLEESGYKVNWSVDNIAAPPEWNTRQAMEFLRILDELLGNALKHGTDDGLSVSLVGKPQLILSIANHVDSAQSEMRDGAGLNNIKIRSKKIKAVFLYSLDENMFVTKLTLDQVR